MFNMKERFWKIIAVLGVASVAYLAHGLHQPGGFSSQPQLLRLAEGSQIVQYGGDILVTVSEDGRTLYFWNLGGPDPTIPSLENVRSYDYQGGR